MIARGDSSSFPPFWATWACAAAALLPAFGLGLLPGGPGEGRDWAQHLGAGGVFAGVFFAIYCGDRRSLPLLVGSGIAMLVALVGMLCRWGLPDFRVDFAVAGLMAGAGYWVARRGESGVVLTSVWVAVGSALGCWALSRLSWWEPFPQRFEDWGNQLVFYAIMAGAVGCLMASERAWTSKMFRLIDAVVLALLAAAVVRTTDMVDNIVAAHHWSVSVGPAEMVREGRGLLGETPSQYGFLGILILAGLPTDSCFEALYWLQVATLWIAGAILYFVLRNWLTAWWWQVGSGVLAVVGTAFFCGDLAQLSGPMVYPNVGAVRFVWIYVLLGWLVWWHRRGTEAITSRATLKIGTGIWLLGALWSVESALYVTAAWLPAASLLAMPGEGHGVTPFSRIKSLARGIGLVLLHVAVALGVTTLVIRLGYHFAYGRAPEWSAYWEYAVSFVGGENLSLLIDPTGPVWALLILQAALIAGLISVKNIRSLALVWAAWGAFWSVATYYTARSHPNNISNLGPVFLLVIGLLLYVGKSTAARSPLRPWLWVLVSTWVAGVLWLVGTNPSALRRQVVEYRMSPEVTTWLPAQRDVEELVAKCVATQAAPYSVIGMNGFATTTIELTKAHPNWLPLRALPLYPPLPKDRRSHYLDVYHGKPKSGWLVAPVYVERYELSWLFDYIDARYMATNYVRNAGWQAWYFEPREKLSANGILTESKVVRWAATPITFLRKFGGNADPRLITGLFGNFASGETGGLLGTTEGKAEMRFGFSVNRLQATLGLRRQPGESIDQPASAEFVIYASQLTQPAERYERWRGRVTLPAGEKEIMVRQEIDGSGLAPVFVVEVPAENANRVLAGWSNPEITHVTFDSQTPSWLYSGGGEATPLNEVALSRLLPDGWRPTQAWMRKGWVSPNGIELFPGGEIWLKAPSKIVKIHGLAQRSDGVVGYVGDVTGLWYKGGRVNAYAPPTKEDRDNGRHSFQAWGAEPDGWLVITLDNAEPWAPVVVRVTAVDVTN